MSAKELNKYNKVERKRERENAQGRNTLTTVCYIDSSNTLKHTFTQCPIQYGFSNMLQMKHSMLQRTYCFEKTPHKQKHLTKYRYFNKTHTLESLPSVAFSSLLHAFINTHFQKYHSLKAFQCGVTVKSQ